MGKLTTHDPLFLERAIFPVAVGKALSPFKLWQADLNLPEEALALGWTWLDFKEKQRARAFQTEALSRRFIAAHSLVRHMISQQVGCPPEELLFAETREGKPFLVAPSARPFFNFSHSESRLLLGVHWEIPVGVDIEAIGSGPLDEGLPETCLTENERRHLSSVGEDARRDLFIRYWTAKEAALKAEGTGLSVEPTALEVTFHGTAGTASLPCRNKTFSCHSLDVGNGFKAALAYATRVTQ